MEDKNGEVHGHYGGEGRRWGGSWPCFSEGTAPLAVYQDAGKEGWNHGDRGRVQPLGTACCTHTSYSESITVGRWRLLLNHPQCVLPPPLNPPCTRSSGSVACCKTHRAPSPLLSTHHARTLQASSSRAGRCCRRARSRRT